MQFEVTTDQNVAHAVLYGDLPDMARLGKRYWTFHQLRGDRWVQDWNEAIAWCRDQFGEPSIYRYWFTCRGEIHICFFQQAHATAFRIRWC